MNYREAKAKSLSRKLIGAAIILPSITSTSISILKMFYYRLDDGTQFGAAISRPFKNLVFWVYDNTNFLSVFWKYSPIPDQMNIKEPQNLYFLLIYLMIFLGIAFFSSGKKLARRISLINENIENQIIKESIKSNRARTRQQIEQETVIPTNSIFSQFHQLYLAPVVTAVIGAVLAKLLGL